MKNKGLVKSVSYSLLAFLFVLIGLSQQVDADTITAGSGNRIHFINTKAKSGSDAILLESNGHYALIDMGKTMTSLMGVTQGTQAAGEFL